MIFPILNGLVGWTKAPITWSIIFLNFLIFSYTSVVGVEAQKDLEEIMKNDFFIVTQGRVYAKYIEAAGNSREYPEFLFELSKQALGGDKSKADTLGQLAFRDLGFLTSTEALAYEGDQVAFRYWKQKVQLVKEIQANHPSFTFGLNGEDMSLSKWVTYIFVHSGGVHFIGNMLFLSIFGAALEAQIGGLALLVVFLLSGVFAAGVFVTMTGIASSPLVGASGAISGVMTLFCLLNWANPQRYFYWLFLPFRGFMGFIYLPAWVALVMWIVSDLAGYLSSLAELGGVAHTAHLGGEIAGFIIVVVLYSFRKYFRQVPFDDRGAAKAVPIGVLYPFLPPR